MHLQLAQVVAGFGPELDALEQLSFHSVWHGLRLLQPDCGGVHVFRMWIREQQHESIRLCLATHHGPACVGLLDVLQRLSFVFGAFLGMRLATPSACICGNVNVLRLHDAKHHAVPDTADVGCSDSDGPPALVWSDSGSAGPVLGAAASDVGSEWSDTSECGSDCDSVCSASFVWANKCLQTAVVGLLRDAKERSAARSYFDVVCGNDACAGVPGDGVELHNLQAVLGFFACFGRFRLGS
jgi:hypothetical protein